MQIAAQMMLRQCVSRAFPTEGSPAINLHAASSRGTAASSRSFHRCCVRANLWRTDHLLQMKNSQSEVSPNPFLGSNSFASLPVILLRQTEMIFFVKLKLHAVPDVFSSIKSWSKLQLVTVSGLAACVVLLVPSAGATDALKTCTCLLKECR
jgi:violaxanthin de-epoxidase